jgi:transposase-like protein
MSENPVSTVRRRHRRSRAEVAQIAASYAQSGLGRSEFCRQQGLSLSTLNKYCPHARHRDSLPSTSMTRNEAELSLAPVEFVEKSAEHTEQHDPLLVELACGRRISVSAGFDAATLTRLIAVLERA